MENIKLFATTALKNTFENSSDYLEPYVSLDEETDKVSYNIEKSIIKITVAQGKTVALYNGTTLKSGINIIDTKFKSLDDFIIANGRENIELVDLSEYKGTKLPNTYFSDCINLRKITLSDNFTTIGQGVFQSCAILADVVIKSSIPSTNLKQILDQIQMVNNVYVPQNAVKAYKTAQGWSAYASMIKPIEQ